MSKTVYVACIVALFVSGILVAIHPVLDRAWLSLKRRIGWS